MDIKAFLVYNSGKKRGIYNSNLSVGTYGNYNFIEGKKDLSYNYKLENGNFASAYYFVNYYRKKRLSWKDIDSRLGLSTSLSYRHIPSSDNYEGSKIYAAGKLYFPGLLKHDNLMITAAYEQQLNYSEKNIYNFSSNVDLPRGYEPGYFDKITKASVDYQLPLFYPDFGILGLVYFKRVRANIFYDVAIGEYKGIEQEFASSGLELAVDFQLLRLPVELNAGLQFYSRMDGNNGVFPMIMGVVPF